VTFSKCMTSSAFGLPGTPRRVVTGSVTVSALPVRRYRYARGALSGESSSNTMIDRVPLRPTNQ